MILSVAAGEFRANGKPNRWGQYDTGAASENLCLQATAQGLAVHQMGVFDADRVHTAFGVPEGFRPMSVIAVGFPGVPATSSDELRERELAGRRRRPLAELYFAARSGEGIGS